MKVLGAAVNLEENKSLLLERYPLLFWALLVSAVMDAVSTTHFMTRIGPEFEANYVVRNLTYSLGTVMGPLLGKAMQIVAVWLLTVFTPKLTGFICVTVVFMNLYAVLVNMLI
jgi:hypothetical protein